MVWRDCKTVGTWQSYGWKVVAFSDQPSSCVLKIAKELTALAGEDIDKVATRSISQDTYVDDGATGGDEETAEILIGEVSTKVMDCLLILVPYPKSLKKEDSA